MNLLIITTDVQKNQVTCEIRIELTISNSLKWFSKCVNCKRRFTKRKLTSAFFSNNRLLFNIVYVLFLNLNQNSIELKSVIHFWLCNQSVLTGFQS